MLLWKLTNVIALDLGTHLLTLDSQFGTVVKKVGDYMPHFRHEVIRVILGQSFSQARRRQRQTPLENVARKNAGICPGHTRSQEWFEVTYTFWPPATDIQCSLNLDTQYCHHNDQPRTRFHAIKVSIYTGENMWEVSHCLCSFIKCLVFKYDKGSKGVVPSNSFFKISICSGSPLRSRS